MKISLSRIFFEFKKYLKEKTLSYFLQYIYFNYLFNFKKEMNRKQEHHRRQFDLSHRFYKDFVGFFLFLFVYFAIFLQIMGVYLTWDYDFESHLIFHKFFFAIICILAIISHIRASFADPGKMNYLNNVEYCNFYLTTHSKSLERAKVLMTQSYTKALIQSLENESEDDEEEESEDDEFEYERKSYISEENRMEISQKFGIDFKRCDKCLVVRPPKVHHCSVCRGCVMRMDHHCPWINNCVGQFNQKFFILFCLYCFLGCLYACVLTPYYIIYLNKNE